MTNPTTLEAAGPPPASDPEKAEAFAGYMLDIINHAALAYMISVGNRTGLFDAMARLGPATIETITGETGLNERYVREWLGGVVTGRIVDYDPAAATYMLPPERAAFITHAAGPNNLAQMTQYFALIGQVEDEIVDCFRDGGGVPYSRFPRFQQLMREESAQVFDASLIDTTLPLVPGLVERLRDGIEVADIGCGAGHAINLMAEAFPNSRFTGFDISEEGIALGRAEAASKGLTNAAFVVRDVAQLAEQGRFDFLTAFDTIHDQARPDQVLRGVYKALRPGGTFLLVDVAGSSRLEENIEHPLCPAMYVISTFHCMTVSLAQGGMGLGTMWGEELATAMLQDAGFEDISPQRIEADIANVYYITHKPA